MRPVKKTLFWLFCVVALAIGGSACTSPSSTTSSSSSKALHVVAAENFYGDIVKQLGGSRVSVTSMLSNPNVDPHEYESSIQNATAVAAADLVIENSGGYDGWMDKLIAGSPRSSRVVLKAFDIAPVKLSDNVHVWYSVDDAQSIAQAITNTLKQLDAADAATFENNFQAFKQSLQPVRQKMADMKTKYAGTSVGLTETIYLYQTGPLGLNVLTPLEFQKAMAEGNDPPANTLVTAEDQVMKKQIKVLIINQQTSSQITDKLQNDARAQHIPIVPVTETMPPNKTYQTWMLDQLTTLEQALGK